MWFLLLSGEGFTTEKSMSKTLWSLLLSGENVTKKRLAHCNSELQIPNSELKVLLQIFFLL